MLYLTFRFGIKSESLASFSVKYEAKSFTEIGFVFTPKPTFKHLNPEFEKKFGELYSACYSFLYISQ